jgi:glycosyltransferase involved in cell wall biosynthesis
MRVLLLTPYSPLLSHDHAANDLALPLVRALAPLIELHVYSPGQKNGNLRSWEDGGVTYHSGSQVQLQKINRIGRYPYAFRESWSKRSTKESIELVRKLQPDILHAEYLQTAEPLVRCAKIVKTSLTLHDVWASGQVAPDSENDSLRKFLNFLEHAKTKRLMSKVLERMSLLMVLSEHDKQRISTAKGIVNVVSVGIESPINHWIGDRENVVAFGGALWRSENESTAIYLACNVLPLVRQVLPNAELRIFGARPGASVRALGTQPGVTVVGEVDDYDEEFCRAAVTLAPTMVNAGILLKAIRAMSVGAPVVLNTASARPIVGLVKGVHALVADSPTEFAAHVVYLMRDKENARKLGEKASELVSNQFSWDQTARNYEMAFSDIAMKLIGKPIVRT